MTTLKMAVFWDAENCRVKDLYTPIILILHLIAKFFPNIELSIKAYANKDRLTEKQRKAFSDANIHLIDIASTEANAADILMMCDMFKYAIKNKPPGYIMILTGDGDFVKAVETFKALDYTTLVVSPDNGSSLLKATADYCFSWEKILEKKGFVSPLGITLKETPRTSKKVPGSESPRASRKGRAAIGVYWDMNTYGLPRNDPYAHENAEDHIRDYLEDNRHISSSTFTFDEYNIYGQEENFPQRRSKGCNFIPTSKEKHEKHLHIENVMIADICKFAAQNPPPCTIMLLTTNQKYTWLISTLERMRYTMLVWFPRQMGHLELAATAATICDWNHPTEKVSTTVKSQRIDRNNQSRKRRRN